MSDGSKAFERLFVIFLCLSVSEAHPGIGDLTPRQHDSTCKVEGFLENGDGSDFHILFQKSVSRGLDDHTQTHHSTATRDWVNAASRKHSQNLSSSFWTHPLVLGLLLGFFLIGPDHLATLMTLSTLSSGLESFKRGFYWGVGHSFGVTLLCPIFLTLEHITSKAVSKETWEYYGDIFIGISMIAVSIYFIHREDLYLQKRADGIYVAKGCECHGLMTPSSETACSEERMDDPNSVWRYVGNSLLGVLQGLCCPVGMAIGTGFMFRVIATASAPMLIAFLVEFVCAAGVACGLIAYGWGALSLKASGTCFSGKAVYITTCILLFLFGVVWLVLHFSGILHHIDFEGKIHDKLLA